MTPNALLPAAQGDASAGAATRPRVLVVDDDPLVVESLRRHLRRHFDLSAATNVLGGINQVVRNGPFAVVLCDMRMPGLDGVSFLRRVRDIAPLTVRVMLTGVSDLDAVVAAINEGSIFRFLCKPCPPDVLLAALQAAVEQHRLVTAERELLEETLVGSVRALVDTLAVASPAAFARGVRVKALVSELLDALEVQDRWQIEAACMLSQLGVVTLPVEVAEKLHQGMELEPEEQAMVDRVPEIAEAILAGIPRMEEVRHLIRAHVRGAPPDAEHPLGAHVLRLAMDYDALEARSGGAAAMAELGRQADHYDDAALAALARIRGSGRTDASGQIDVALESLQPGMVLASDLRLDDGALLVGRGQEITPSLLERIRNFATRIHPGSPVTILS